MPKAIRASTNRYEMIKLAYERKLSPDDLTKCNYKKYHLFGGQHNSGGTLIFLRCVNCRKKVRKTNHGDQVLLQVTLSLLNYFLQKYEL